MPELRTVRADELADVLAFSRAYAGTECSLRAFRRRFEEHPDLFVVSVEEGEVVAEAHGRPRRPEEDPTGSTDDRVVLDAVAVKRDRRGDGLGRTVLACFEDRARDYAGSVSAAAAANVEGFYRRCGYEPEMVLLQVDERDRPASDRLESGHSESDRLESDLPQADGSDADALPASDRSATLLGERVADSGDRFLYVGFEEYGPDVREELAAAFDASRANTIYVKEV